jgi:hypothetical protein
MNRLLDTTKHEDYADIVRTEWRDSGKLMLCAKCSGINEAGACASKTMGF